MTGLNRHEATRRVMMTVAFDPTVELPYVSSDGERPLVVTTPSEYLSEVLRRVEAVGGHANIALARAKDFEIFVLESADPAEVDSDSAESAPEVDRLNADMSMGMFLIRSQRRQGHRFAIRGVAASTAPSKSIAYA